MGYTVRWNRSAIHEILKGRNGLVAKDLARRAYKVRSIAVANCPVDTGLLRSSIHVVIEEDAVGVYADVGTNVEYAIYVHEGTRYMVGRPFLTDALESVAN